MAGRTTIAKMKFSSAFLELSHPERSFCQEVCWLFLRGNIYFDGAILYFLTSDGNQFQIVLIFLWKIGL